jgi:hypothetical protein
MSLHRSEEVEHLTSSRIHAASNAWESDSGARQQELMGEYGLVEAVLREAIREYQKFAGQQTRRGSRLFREVHEWFLADDRDWDFSFINVCQILNLEPTYIRTGLKMWHDSNRKDDSAMLPTAAPQRPARRSPLSRSRDTIRARPPQSLGRELLRDSGR